MLTASRTSSESQASGVVGGPGPTGPLGLGPKQVKVRVCGRKSGLIASTSTFTIEGLDASDVVRGEDKGVGVAVGVHGEHERARIAGVGQAQGVSELMGSHQEQDVT